MKASRRELKYAAEHFNEVHHTTLNPEGPGVVRIHLIPPIVEDNQIEASVAIINGQDIIPVNVSWSILLTEFIEEVNKYAGREITDEDADTIRENTVTSVKKVYPFVSRKRLKEDIFRIMNAFKQVAYGEEVEESIGYMDMGDYAMFMRAPHRMDLMVSAMTCDGKWHCNQSCIHCYAAGQEQSSEKELSTEEWKKIIDKCREVGIPQLTFTGGEPTMRDDLFELIDHAKWFITRLNTNGIKLTKEYCEKLKKASTDSVQITFYSADEAVHNKLVGAPRYKETVAGIENALAAGINISINTPLCTLNRDYVNTLIFLHDKGVTYVTCSGLITTGNAAGEESAGLQLTNAEIREILKESVSYCFNNGMEISFTSPGWVDDEFCNELGITTPSCGAGLSNMAITPGGNVVPCQSWLNDRVLGNFLNDEWDKIWNSEACRARREFSSLMRCECPLRIVKKDAFTENTK
ncbi:MAG: radical SAM protein [Lachnospiraceae bacterium]|nr:radical SAM protein [Lachnospiraceae bacterium]